MSDLSEKQKSDARWMHHRVGGWISNGQDALGRWLDKIIGQTEPQAPPSGNQEDFHPVIEEFKNFIESDPGIYMGFHEMFQQIPDEPPYNEDPKGDPQVRDYMTMLRLFNHIITTAPKFEENDFIGFPINAILNWPMGTPAGRAMLCDPRVNNMFKKMFDVWSTFLTSPESCYVLSTEDDGWFGPRASVTIPNFEKTFICDATQPHWGFKSWEDFFTRRYRDGVRPVQDEAAARDDIVVNACESTIYRIQSNVQANEQFWIKGQPYNLRFMLNHGRLVDTFVGGTVYQAYLGALNYHRWHSPVNGKIVKIEMVKGTYYAASPTAGFSYEIAKESFVDLEEPQHPDPSAPNGSQAFITSTAARAIIYIQANEPIGLMCFMAVGMAEVSTCEVTVKEGDDVRKGEQLGMFHYGGSTHCLIFRPEVKVDFKEDLQTDENVPLNAVIATVSSR